MTCVQLELIKEKQTVELLLRELNKSRGAGDLSDMYNSASPVVDANGHNAHAALAASKRETEQLRKEVNRLATGELFIDLKRSAIPLGRHRLVHHKALIFF